MLIYLIIGTAVLIPSLAPINYKKQALFVSFLLLLIPWGLQYKVTQDWLEYVNRWMAIKSGEITLGQRTLEVGYYWLVKMFLPIGLFGFLFVSATFFLSILYVFITKYVSKRWYWLSILLLMCNSKLGFLFIDTNRQTISLGLTMIGVYILLYEGKILKNVWIGRFLLYFVLIFFAANIHISAYTALLLFPIYYIAKNVKHVNISISLIIFNILYFGRFFFEADLLKEWLNNIWMVGFVSDSTDIFSGYLEEVEMATDRGAISAHFISLLFCNSFIVFYHNMKKAYRFFGICLLVNIILDGYFIQTFQRVLVFFNVYSIIIMPIILQYIKIYTIKFFQGREASKILIVLVVFINVIYLHRTLSNNIYYTKWRTDFKTVFEAPRWM